MPVATIKYYLREGLLPPGASRATNQADYDDDHLRRLRLVRVLREVGDLSIQAIRDVVAAIDDPDRSLHGVLGVAHRATSPKPRRRPQADIAGELGEVDRFLDSLGWEVAADAPDRAALARALRSLRATGRDVDTAAFVPYADAAESIAAFELGQGPPAATREEAVERAVVGTVVFGEALAALRRLAQEHHSARRHAGSSAR